MILFMPYVIENMTARFHVIYADAGCDQIQKGPSGTSDGIYYAVVNNTFKYEVN